MYSRVQGRDSKGITTRRGIGIRRHVPERDGILNLLPANIMTDED